MDETAARKQRLRAELLAARRARAPGELERARAAVRGHVLERAVGVTCVAAYVPFRTEPGSVELLASLVDRDVRVLVPIMLADRDLDWAEWSPAGRGEPLGPGALGAAELVLVPALAVAVDGTRLGRGGASYDRALTRCAPGAVVAALLFDGEVVTQLPRHPWDRPVRTAVTPSGWIDFDGNADFEFER